MKHIVLCTNIMSNGGAERVISLWAEGFLNLGYKVSIILKNETDSPYMLSPQIRLFYLGQFTGCKLSVFIKREIRLRELLNSISPDIIITALNPWGFWIYLASVGKKWKIVNTEHNPFDRPASMPFSKTDLFYKFTINKLFKTVTVLTKADQKNIGKKLSNTIVLPNPLTFTPSSILPPKEKIILSIGRIDAWKTKGFDILIKAWNNIAKQHPDWTLHIIGRGNKTNIDYLTSLISNDIKAQVLFEKFNDNIIEHYQKAAIYVLSSRYEGFGMVLLEAMSQGCCCISTDFGGRQSEILDHELNGLICPSEDAIALSNALEKVISNEDLRIKYAYSAIDKSKHFTLDKIMMKWQNIIKELYE